MARKKQTKFTADPDVQELIEKYLLKYPNTSLSKIINLIMRQNKK